MKRRSLSPGCASTANRRLACLLSFLLLLLLLLSSTDQRQHQHQHPFAAAVAAAQPAAETTLAARVGGSRVVRARWLRQRQQQQQQHEQQQLQEEQQQQQDLPTTPLNDAAWHAQEGETEPEEEWNNEQENSNQNNNSNNKTDTNDHEGAAAEEEEVTAAEHDTMKNETTSTTATLSPEDIQEMEADALQAIVAGIEAQQQQQQPPPPPLEGTNQSASYSTLWPGATDLEATPTLDQTNSTSSSSSSLTMGQLHMTQWPGGTDGTTFPPDATTSTTTITIAPALQAENLTVISETTVPESSLSSAAPMNGTSAGNAGADAGGDGGGWQTMPPTPAFTGASSTLHPRTTTTARPSVTIHYPLPPQPTPTHPPKPPTSHPTSSPHIYMAPDDDVLRNKQDDQVVEEAWTSKSSLQQAQETAAAMLQDRNVKIVTSIVCVLAFALLLCTAQQLLEHPDGWCSRICKFSVACCTIACWPCRMVLSCAGAALCCPNRMRRGGHVLVANDAGGNDGFGFSHDLELS